MRVKSLVIILILAILLGTFACIRTPSTSTTSAITYSRYQLEYLLITKYSNLFWCDPDLYPVARPEQEMLNAIDLFPDIRANTAEFSAILEHLNMQDKANYSDAEKLSIYREHKELTAAVQMTPSGNDFQYNLAIGEGQGFRIEGTITLSGKITETKRESTTNTCPICLAEGTLIDTPAGPIPVEQLHQGTMVWTVDNNGKRIAAPIVQVHITIVPLSFKIERVQLEDGRIVMASPGHPTAEGRVLADYKIGDIIDGSLVVSIDFLSYDKEATYDLLPAGPTGFYWANSILLKSTLIGQ